MTEIRTVAETGSTNADMLALAGKGLDEGIWLRAERQVMGRGRMGRAWESPAGNVHASTLVRLRPADPPVSSLALVAAVAVHDALSGFAPGRLGIKWPNDILAGKAKLCGMLLERAGDAIVLGVGVNITASPDIPNRPTTSLWALGAVEADAAAVTAAIADRFALWLGRWREAGVAPIIAAWSAAAHPVGTPLSILTPDGRTVEGSFAGLDPTGALNLRLANGSTHAMHAGDVFLL